MKTLRVITGSWYPRTRFHLEEYFRFLNDGKSDLPIGAIELKQAYRNLAPSNVEYVGLARGGRFDYVAAEMDGVDTRYYEDGLLLMSRDVSDLDDDIEHLHSFYSEQMSPSLTLLYSVGVPAVTFSGSFGDRDLLSILICSSAGEEEVLSLYKSRGLKLDYILKYKQHTVYFSDSIIVIVTRSRRYEFTDRLASSFIFFYEYESHLNRLLNLHRTKWHRIKGIREDGSISLKDLPRIRDLLLDDKRDLSVVVSRLGQMRLFLDERQAEIDESGDSEYFRALEAYRFGKGLQNTVYMEKLWWMLSEYIDSTVNIIGLMYQDNLQRQLSVQQFIFLLGTIGGILLLGRFKDINLDWVQENGDLGYLGSLAFFGVTAVVLTSVIFIVLKKILPRFFRVRSYKLFGSRKLFKE